MRRQLCSAAAGAGRGVALELAKPRSDVAVVYRLKHEAAERVAETIRAFGIKASAHRINVLIRTEVVAGFAAAVAARGRIHTVV